MSWSRVIGGFGVAMGVTLVVVGVLTANPVAIYYGGELSLLGAAALMTGSQVNTVGPSY